MDWTEKPLDVISTGEILIDMIGQQSDSPLSETLDFQRFLGGSPANVAFNLNDLNLNVRFVGSIGKDGLGEFVLKKFQSKNFSIDGLKQIDDAPTSIIVVSKTAETPEFITYRGADFQIHVNQFTEDTLKKAKVFHTTCFALSKKPAQNSILNAAKKAKQFGTEISIDLNYATKIWPDKAEAQAVIGEFLQLNPLLKISEDDVQRLLGKKLSHDEIFNYFQNKFQLNKIYLTLGSQGVKYLNEQNKIVHLPAQPIDEVKDATGAGDAFWSGFLYGFTQNLNQEQCLKMGLKLAAIKLQHVGGLPEDLEAFYDKTH
ncbi:carbohydrate kinase family protein [Mesohalobacter halotolerans]|uniref:Carbohydrate kinase n=1 Tax=Mesohalobacter halotolerans TaxID=1883405 RepID=A0A4V6XYB6_9FLAO|nr:PfkB family carbohydrate kinase [Mesohalobacter halotolerans]TKS57235.1 carbohydrate kinase [Mesohalobacter halotolerans]